MNVPTRRCPRVRRWPAGSAAAAAAFVVLLATAGRYGLHGDELYFRMLSIRWWYDDQPPLTVWLARLARAAGDAPWLQRWPAAFATAAGAFVAAAYPRLLGYGRRVQELAAWSHVGAAYTLVVGHVFLTSTFDLLAWQLVVLCVVAACLGHRHALVWAGALAGVACWNKLLVVPLVGALVVALLIARRDLVRTRQFAAGAGVFALVGGPQIAAQAAHGWPMAAVSSDFAAANGDSNRWLVLPLLVAFVGPPLLGVCVRGLVWRPPGSRIGLLGPAAAVLVAFNLYAPAQPYYAVALLLAALSLGWGPTSDAGGAVWRRAGRIVAASTVVAALVSLPLLPPGSRAYSLVAAVNPPNRDQVGWPSYVRQVDAARGGADVGVVADAYALAGAVAYESDGRIDVASGHNALWREGPPSAHAVVLVGRRAVALRGRFAGCTDAGILAPAVSDPFRLAGSPMALCYGPLGGWAAVWPAFRHLGA